MMSGNGSYKPRSSEDGANWTGKVMALIQFCFAMETRESARRLSGNKG